MHKTQILLNYSERNLPNTLHWAILAVCLYTVIGTLYQDEKSNFGTDFIIGIMSIPRLDDIYPDVLITSYSVVDVSITSPTWIKDNGEMVVSLTTSLDGVTRYNLKLSDYMASDIPPINCTSLHIQSNDSVSVVVKYIGNFSQESFLAFPVSSLGIEYYAVAWCEGIATCQIGIVASEHDTTVNITTSPDVYGSASKSLQMQKYTMTILESKIDPTGTKIVSNHPIVVYGGSTMSQVGHDNNTVSNQLLEQLPPVTTWGKVYIVFSNPSNKAGSFIRILKQKDVDTRLELSGRGWLHLGTEKTWIQLRVLHKESYVITASKGILVCGFLSGGRDIDKMISYPSMMVYQPAEQFILEEKNMTFLEEDGSSVFITVGHRAGKEPDCGASSPPQIMSKTVIDGTEWQITTFEIKGTPTCTFQPPSGIYTNGHGVLGSFSLSVMAYWSTISTNCVSFAVLNATIRTDICPDGIGADMRSRDQEETKSFYLPPAFALEDFDVFVYEHSKPTPFSFKTSEPVSYITIDNSDYMTRKDWGHILYVDSNETMTVYWGFKGEKNGVSVVYPQHVLGTDHVLVTWCETGMCRCDAVTVHNYTLLSIRIKLTNSTGHAFVDGQKKEANTWNIEIRKDELEVTIIESEDDLTGSRIQSNGPLAVFCYSRRIDQLENLIQLLPVEKLSTYYQTLGFPKTNIGKVRVVSVMDNTKVTISDFTIYLMNSGDFYDYDMSFTNNTSVNGNANFMAIQGLWNVGSNSANTDPLFFLPQHYQTTYLFYSNDFGSNQLTLYSDNWKNINMRVSNNVEAEFNSSLNEINPSPNGIFRIEDLYANNSFLAYMYRKKEIASMKLFDITFVQTAITDFGVLTVCRLEYGKRYKDRDEDCDRNSREEVCYPDYPITDDDFDGTFGEDCKKIDGGWSCWNEWSNCTGTCGQSLRARTRICDDPVPDYGGSSCRGESREEEHCVTQTTCYTAKTMDTATSFITATYVVPVSAYVTTDQAPLQSAGLSSVSAIAHSTQIATGTSTTNSDITYKSSQGPSTGVSASTSPGYCLCKRSDFDRLQEIEWFRSLNASQKLLELQRRIKIMRDDLTIDRKNTSAYIASKRSAEDFRPLTNSLGALGVVLLSALLVIIIFLDFPTLSRDFSILKNNISRS
ncbi:hypothetical protein ScPMuIL_010332 [Solemya velum]